MNKKFSGKVIMDRSRVSVCAVIRVTTAALRSSFIPRHSALIPLLVLALLLPAFGSGAFSQGVQQNKRRAQSSARSHETAKPVEPEMVEHAMAAVCTEREADPHGSVPIDEVQARPT